MWDIQAEEPLICMSEIDEYFHREAITQLLWVPVISGVDLSSMYNIVSLGTDGKILFWRQSDLLKFPIRGYLLAQKEQTKANPLSGTCMEFCQDTQSLIIGSISGALWKIGSGSLTSPVNPLKKGANITSMQWKPSANSIRDHIVDPEIKREITEKVERFCRDRGIKEVDYNHIFEAKIDQRALYNCTGIFPYEFHSGPVTSIKASPFQRNLFLTASSDGSIRIYDQMQKNYIFHLEPGVTSEVTSIDWSPLRPGSFASSSSNSEIAIYDFNCNKSAPVVRLQSPMKSPATIMHYNAKLTGYMAAGYENGTVNIYRLNKYYSVGTVMQEEHKVWKGLIEEESKI